MFSDTEDTSLLGSIGFGFDGSNGGEDKSLCPSLSLPQRLFGCSLCLVVSWILSFGAFKRIILLIKGNPQPFVVFFSLGVIINLMSSFFITGPQKQLTQMFDEKRRYASSILISSLGLTLYVATFKHLTGQAIILIVLLLIQCIAQLYYVITYIPFGMDMLKSGCSTGCNKAKESICRC